MQRAGWGFVPQPALSFYTALLSACGFRKTTETTGTTICLRFSEDNRDNGDNKSACGFWKTTGTTILKWQPAFRLVKVVFVVVTRQHRV